MIDVTAENLYKELVKLIPNIELRTLIAAEGRAYVEKYHDPKSIVNDVLKMLNGNVSNSQSEFQPTFLDTFLFLNRKNQSMSIINGINMFLIVIGIKNIQGGERSNLLF